MSNFYLNHITRPNTAGDAGRHTGSRMPSSLPPKYSITTNWKPKLDVTQLETIDHDMVEQLLEPFPVPVLKVS